MGFFDFFKPKALTHEQKVEMAYSCYKQDMVEKIFPQGKQQASKIICSLAKIYNLKLEECDAKKYYEILSTYTAVLIRKVISKSSDNAIMQNLQVEYKELVEDKEIARLVLTFCILNMNDNAFSLDTEQNCTKLKLTNDMYVGNEKIAKQNLELEKKFINDPDYGFVPEKPIFTCGVKGSEKYLEQLCFENGERIQWNRVGSTSVDGVNGMIDVYEISTLSGEKYKELYINMYGSSDSRHAPKGFIIDDVIFF